MKSLSASIDSFLEQRANESQRAVAGGATWRASLIGNCLRAQYLECVAKVPKRPLDARTARIFEVGHLTGRMVEGWLKDMGLPFDAEVQLYDEELDLGAHADFIIEHNNEVLGVELKSKSSKSFWWAKKKDEPVAGHNQLLQAAACSVLAKRNDYHVDRWVVLSISKDDLVLAETPTTNAHEVAVLERLDALNNAKEYGAGNLLPCSCFTDFGNKGPRYCGYGVDDDHCCGTTRAQALQEAS